MYNLVRYTISIGNEDLPEAFNAALVVIQNALNDGSVHNAINGSVADRLSTPPANPADGAAYIVTATATGDWVGKENQVAFWLDSFSDWLFTAPATGNIIWVEDEAAYYLWNGSVWAITTITTFDQSLNSTDAVTFSSVTAATFTGDLTGNVTGNADTATLATSATNVVFLPDNSTDATNYPLFAAVVSGGARARTDSALTYNPSTGIFSSAAFSGDGSALSNVDAVTLDGISSEAFGQLAVSATWTAQQIFKVTSAVGIATATGSLATAEIRGNGAGGAFIGLHRPGTYAAYFGLDTDSILKWGGWSEGAVAYKIWEEKSTPVVTQAEAEAGSSTSNRIWTPERIAQAISALGGSTITYGSNANGAYVQLPAGVQICWNGGFTAGSSATTWTFPSAFDASPAVFAQTFDEAGEPVFIEITALNSSSVSLKGEIDSGGAEGNLCCVMAIGTYT